MGRGRRAVEVVLTGAERETLERWARRPKSSQALALRCRIVLGAAGGETNKSMAARLGCSEATVSKWRRRFAQRRLDGLADDPRPGPPRTITDEMVEEVIVRTLESAPAGATHWSTRSMAEAVGMSQSSISRVWRAFGLKPHLAGEFKLSPDPQFIDKVRDVVGLYLNPPDELSSVVGVQALGLAPLDAVFADPGPKGARTDPEIAGDLNDRPSRLPDDPHSTGPELRIVLASCV